MNTKNTLYYSPPQPLTGKRHIFAVLLMLSFSYNATAQFCEPAIEATTPTIHFSVHGDGTVTHKKTGLMWRVCSQGQSWDAAAGGSCSGAVLDHNWRQALQIPQTLNAGAGYAGHTDWRLPNIKELKSIVELKCRPTINAAIFPIPSTIMINYWSSTPSRSHVSTWGVDFRSGHITIIHRTDMLTSVRLVRGGQQ